MGRSDLQAFYTDIWPPGPKCPFFKGSKHRVATQSRLHYVSQYNCAKHTLFLSNLLLFHALLTPSGARYSRIVVRNAPGNRTQRGLFGKKNRKVRCAKRADDTIFLDKTAPRNNFKRGGRINAKTPKPAFS